MPVDGRRPDRSGRVQAGVTIDISARQVRAADHKFTVIGVRGGKPTGYFFTSIGANDDHLLERCDETPRQADEMVLHVDAGKLAITLARTPAP